jgi:hypothetical protein
VTSHHDSRDDGLIGVLAVAAELYPGWLWACAVEEGEQRRLLQSSPIPGEARAGFEEWARDLLGGGDDGEPAGDADAVDARSFVVEDPAMRTVAIMGYGPSAVVAPESDVILGAVARNLKVFEEGRRAA